MHGDKIAIAVLCNYLYATLCYAMLRYAISSDLLYLVLLCYCHIHRLLHSEPSIHCFSVIVVVYAIATTPTQIITISNIFSDLFSAMPRRCSTGG